jgi:acyl-CoA thioesterase-1
MTGCAGCRRRRCAPTWRPSWTRSAAAIPTLLAGMIAPPNLGGEYGREFAGVFQALARERPDLVHYPFLLDGVAGEPALNQPDRIHPTARGADLIARRMLPFIETLLDRVRVSAAG